MDISALKHKMPIHLMVVFAIAFVVLVPNVAHAYGTAAPWDEQLGMTLAQNYTALGYNVTAVAQTSGTSGTGPGYLLNGLSNTGYWYQVGLSWNWATFFGYSPNNFLFTYELFAPNGTSIYPSSGAGLLTLSGPVNEGDIVLLNLYFVNNTVELLVKDWNTGATGHTSMPAYGATEFVGNPYGKGSGEGFFTGVMTEWYGTDSSFPIQQPVTYSPYGTITSPAWLWADEFYCNAGCAQKSDVTQNTSSSYEYPTAAHYVTLTAGSTVEYTDGAVFITGATPPPPAAPIYLSPQSVPTVQRDISSFARLPQNEYVNVSVIGGTAPYNYSLYIGNRLWGIWSENYSSTVHISLLNFGGNLSFLSPGGEPIGTYYYNITVTDSEGTKAATLPGELIVNPEPRISLNAQKTTVDEGQILRADYSVSEGTAPYNVSYFVNGRDIGTALALSNAGQYSVYARVVDADGEEANSSVINFNVNQKPSIDVSYNRTTTDINTPINLVADGSYGTQPYSYNWYVNNRSVGSSSAYAFEESQGGDYVVFASLTDGAGDVINSSQTTFVVNSKPSASGLKVLPSSSGIAINNTANGAVSMSGGSPPYSYKWYVNGVLQNDSNSSSYILTNLKSGSNNVTVEAKDAYGNSAESSYVINTSTNYSIIIGAVVVGLIIVGGLVYLFVLRKPKGSSNKGKEKEDALYCHKCGAKNLVGAKYCHKCGAKLKERKG